MTRLEERSKYREHLVKLAKDSVVERASKLFLAQFRPQLDHLSEGDQVPNTVPIGKERFVDWVKNVITNFFPEVHGVTENEKILKEYAVQIADSIAKSDTNIQNPLRDYVVSKDPIFIRAGKKVYIKKVAETFVPSGSLKTPNLYEAPQVHSRYCPDHPAAMLRRISDNVYQCPISGDVSIGESWKDKYSYSKGHEVKFDMGVHNQTSQGPSNAHPILPFLSSGSEKDSDAHKAKAKDYDFEKLYGVTVEFPARQEKKKASILLSKIMKIAEEDCDTCIFEEVKEDKGCSCKGECDCKGSCNCEGDCSCKKKEASVKLAQQFSQIEYNADPKLQLEWNKNQLKLHEAELQKETDRIKKDHLKDLIQGFKTNIEDLQKQLKEVKTAQQLFAPTTMVSRQCPDHPGQQLERIADNERKCPLDGKIYNYSRGFTTEDGKEHLGGSVQNQGAIPIGSSLIVNKKASKIVLADSPLVHKFLFGLRPYLPETATHERRVLDYKFSENIDLEQAIQAIKQADELAAQQKAQTKQVASVKSFTKESQKAYTKQDYKDDMQEILTEDFLDYTSTRSNPDTGRWADSIYDGEMPASALVLLEKADKLFGMEEASDIVKEVVESLIK